VRHGRQRIRERVDRAEAIRIQRKGPRPEKNRRAGGERGVRSTRKKEFGQTRVEAGVTLKETLRQGGRGHARKKERPERQGEKRGGHRKTPEAPRKGLDRSGIPQTGGKKGTKKPSAERPKLKPRALDSP